MDAIWQCYVFTIATKLVMLPHGQMLIDMPPLPPGSNQPTNLWLTPGLKIYFPCLVVQAHEFWREAEILSKLHHPNVVAFYGVVKDGPGGTLATVTEFMVNGSLRHVLQRKDK